MEYSFTPRGEFTFILSLLVSGIPFSLIGIAMSASVSLYNETNHNQRKYWPIWVGVCITTLFSATFFYYNRTIPLNQKVVGTLVQQYSQEEYTTGKHKQLINQGYVVYRVPEGEVSFRRGTGVVYPKNAILYMNKSY